MSFGMRGGLGSRSRVVSALHRWNARIPGHYQLLFRNRVDTDGDGIPDNHPPSDMAVITGDNDFKGTAIQVEWRHLEGSKDNYQIGFDLFQTYFDYVNANQGGVKRLFLQPNVNSFSATKATPNYIHNPTDPDYDTAYDSEGVGTGGIILRPVTGWLIKTWNPAVVLRVIALYQALAAHFRNDPIFEGIFGTETAHAGATSSSGYSTAGSEQGWKDIFLGAQLAMPNHIYFAGLNFHETAASLRNMADLLVDNGIGHGGPDLPVGRDLSAPDTNVNAAFKAAREHSFRHGNATAPIGYQTQGQGFTSQQFLDYGYDQLGNDYFFWNLSRATGINSATAIKAAVTANLAANSYPWSWIGS